MAKTLEKPKLNKSKTPVADTVIGQMIAGESSPNTPPSETDNTKSDNKMAYKKDASGVTVGPNGKKIGRPKKEDAKEQISFSISKETKKNLDAYIANHDEFSKSSVCATAIKEYLKNHS